MKDFPFKGNVVISHWVERVNVFLVTEERGQSLVAGISWDPRFELFWATAIQCRSPHFGLTNGGLHEEFHLSPSPHPLLRRARRCDSFPGGSCGMGLAAFRETHARSREGE